MEQHPQNFSKRGLRHRRRGRIASCLSSPKRRAIGFSSLAAPIAGYIVNDLRKPDSVIRSLVAGAVSRLRVYVDSRAKKELDIGDKAEIVVHDNGDR
jgi:hypothetical protein